MFCGSFSHVDDTPARSRRPKRKGGDNPYAGRGLDKFASVLEELEAKKEKIIAQLGPRHEGAWVRFVQSSSNEWMPIIVRPKDSKVNDKVPGKSPRFSGKKPKASAAELSPAMSPKAKKVVEGDHDEEGRKELNNCFSWKDHKEGGLRVLRYWRPSYYCYVAFVLVLVCVVMFGRSFAIVCTSIWWYMIPALKGENTNVRKSMKMKEYGRRISWKKVSGEQMMIKAGSPLRILGSS